jgi:flagellar hook-associated protein 2
MTQQFSSMNSKVTAYKATQTFLENQIKAWNKDS